MLLLSRALGETIHIGADIVIQVTSLSPNQVVIGVAAPKDVRVMRGELLHTPDAKMAQPRRTGGR